jgi:F-type H+-transporting ATPase subunit gamma
MSERLSDVETRIDTVRQLDSVITAMRGMAAARAHEARERVAGIRTCAEMIGDAIATVLMLNDENAPSDIARTTDRIVIVLCSEQGFAGTFNERVLDAVVPLRDMHGLGACELMVVGDRGAMVAEERHWPIAWSAPAIAHAGEAAQLADTLTRELYRRLSDGQLRYAKQVVVVHALPDAETAFQIRSVQLLPFDFKRFPPAGHASAPILTMPPSRLLEMLAEEYVNAQLCEAVMLSFAAENEARMYAMISARAHVRDTLGTLVDRARRLRQEEITAEIVELSGSRYRDADAVQDTRECGGGRP